MLLYLAMHSMPDIANVCQELSKIMDGANLAAFHEMHQVIKYVLDTRSLGLKFKLKGIEKEPWDITCFGNNDYAGDPVTRRSINGFVLLFWVHLYLGNQRHREVLLC